MGTSGDQPAELGIIVGVLMGILLITGDYYADINSMVEMTDNNDYYSGDYEAGTIATRDNNSQYGY